MPQQPPSPLRLRRFKLGQSLVPPAAAVGTDPIVISRLERGLIVRPDLVRKLIAYYKDRERAAKTAKKVAS